MFIFKSDRGYSKKAVNRSTKGVGDKKAKKDEEEQVKNDYNDSRESDLLLKKLLSFYNV